MSDKSQQAKKAMLFREQATGQARSETGEQLLEWNYTSMKALSAEDHLAGKEEIDYPAPSKEKCTDTKNRISRKSKNHI